MKLPAVLTLIFIVLKLCGVIAWSWWWVLSPELIAFSFFFLVAIVEAIALNAVGNVSSPTARKPYFRNKSQ